MRISSISSDKRDYNEWQLPVLSERLGGRFRGREGLHPCIVGAESGATSDCEDGGQMGNGVRIGLLDAMDAV